MTFRVRILTSQQIKYKLKWTYETIVTHDVQIDIKQLQLLPSFKWISFILLSS